MSALTDATETQCSQLWKGAQKNNTLLNVVCDGNSMTFGAGGTPYPTQLLAMLPAGSTVVNKGVGAQNIQHMIADAATDIDPLASTQGKRNILVVLELRNDMYTNSASAAQAVANLETYCNARRKRGFAKIIVCTVAKMGGFGIGAWSLAGWQAVNAELRNRYKSFADELVDLAADPRLQDNTNLTYYDADQVHHNTAGYGVYASLIAPKVLAV